MAVFTEVRNDDAKAFLSAYELGALEAFAPIAEGVENTNYRVRLGGRDFVLTLFEKRVRPGDLPYYFGLTDHLANGGAPAPRTMRTRTGQMVGELNGRPAALIAWVPGQSTANPTRMQAHTAGAMLADLHLHALGYERTLDNAWALNSWLELSNTCVAAAQRPDHVAMANDLLAEVSYLRACWPESILTGAIHGDYFPENVLFTGEDITGVIDYYFACTSELAYDLAIALNAWGFDGEGRYLPQIAAAISAGYDARRPLSSREIVALPILCRGAAVRFTLTRLHDVIHHDDSWMVRPKDPAAFYARLNYHRSVSTSAAYGLAA